MVLAQLLGGESQQCSLMARQNLQLPSYTQNAPEHGVASTNKIQSYLHSDKQTFLLHLIKGRVWQSGLALGLSLS